MVGSKTNYGYRANPQLSANQMAEYLAATASRRKSIIREARFPRTSAVARYNKARECLVNFLTDGSRSLNHIASAIDHLSKRESRPGATDWVKTDCRFSIEAIDRFQRSYNRLGLASVLCEKIHGRQPALVFGPTKVSVSLDVLTRKRNRDEPDSIGGAILVFSRGEGSGRQRVERCKTVAGLAYEFCLTHLESIGEADTSICLGIDVFGERSHLPHGTFSRKRKHIQDSCDEIGSRWRSVDPPPDYDGPDPS